MWGLLGGRAHSVGRDALRGGLYAPRGRDDVANAVCGLIALMKRKRRNWGHIPATAITRNTAGDVFVNGQHVRGPATRPGLVRTPRGDWESYHDPRGEPNHG